MPILDPRVFVYACVGQLRPITGGESAIAFGSELRPKHSFVILEFSRIGLEGHGPVICTDGHETPRVKTFGNFEMDRDL